MSNSGLFPVPWGLWNKQLLVPTLLPHIWLTYLPAYLWIMQAEWKPEAPEKFGEITELVKSVETLKIGETKQGDPLATISLLPVSFFLPCMFELMSSV